MPPARQQLRREVRLPRRARGHEGLAPGLRAEEPRERGGLDPDKAAALLGGWRRLTPRFPRKA